MPQWIIYRVERGRPAQYETHPARTDERLVKRRCMELNRSRTYRPGPQVHYEYRRQEVG